MKKRSSVKWLLVFYDVLLYIAVSWPLLYLHPSENRPLLGSTIRINILVGMLCIIIARIVFGVYKQIWRYGGMKAYLDLAMADICGGAVYFLITRSGLIPSPRAIMAFSIVCVDLLFAIIARMFYYQMYQYGSRLSKGSELIRLILYTFAGVKVSADEIAAPLDKARKIKVAIVGAGRLGIALADDMLANPNSVYYPVCFIDIDKEKIGRTLMGLDVLSEAEATPAVIAGRSVQEIVFALPKISALEKQKLYNYYKSTGCRIKVYDFPFAQFALSGRRQLREFEIEELLPRRTIDFENMAVTGYYQGKVVMVTGGGGSIGSELARQVAAMKPKRLIIVDFAENTTYELQQDLLSAYKSSEKTEDDWQLDLRIEICNVCDKRGMDKLFSVYRPQILLHAAAHKHVPLMEHNCVEAVKNNVFGTKVVSDLAVKYGAEKFTLISSDKAVNPTNVMGATKRMCEMIVMSHVRLPDADGKAATAFCAVRFGNVMGSAGSVIPLFKKQIAAGGPITITDKRIIRYFMTISEASHLVLEAGAKAKNGELFVLDMGEPVKILDMAENMIRLSGLKPYDDVDIIETGLRPGEKLYEELLMQSETLSKTDNDLIFIEKDEPLSLPQLNGKLAELQQAVDTEDDNAARLALKSVISTYKSPDEVNKNVEHEDI